jgi:hypothetical protein
MVTGCGLAWEGAGYVASAVSDGALRVALLEVTLST